jgi:predicted metal-dependent enzyme (double-stranded beta helix superfamily)
MKLIDKKLKKTPEEIKAKLDQLFHQQSWLTKVATRPVEAQFQELILKVSQNSNKKLKAKELTKYLSGLQNLKTSSKKF